MFIKNSKEFWDCKMVHNSVAEYHQWTLKDGHNSNCLHILLYLNTVN